MRLYFKQVPANHEILRKTFRSLPKIHRAHSKTRNQFITQEKKFANQSAYSPIIQKLAWPTAEQTLPANQSCHQGIHHFAWSHAFISTLDEILTQHQEHFPICAVV